MIRFTPISERYRAHLERGEFVLGVRAWPDEKLGLVGRSVPPSSVDDLGGWGRSRLQPASPQILGLGRCPPGTHPSHPAVQASVGRGSPDPALGLTEGLRLKRTLVGAGLLTPPLG